MICEMVRQPRHRRVCRFADARQVRGTIQWVNKQQVARTSRCPQSGVDRRVGELSPRVETPTLRPACRSGDMCSGVTKSPIIPVEIPVFNKRYKQLQHRGVSLGGRGPSSRTARRGQSAKRGGWLLACTLRRRRGPSRADLTTPEAPN